MIVQSPIPADDLHEHLCIYCGKWSQASGESLACRRCGRNGPAIHNAHQLLGAWGLNVFLEEQGVTEGIVDPVWTARVRAGEIREEVTLEIY